MNPHRNRDRSSWTVPPNWENTWGLEYNLFITDIAPNTLHSQLRDRFKDEPVFVEIVDALLGITDSTSERNHKKAAHRAEGYFIKDEKLWKLGSFTPARATARRECITKQEAVELARTKHNKLHMHHDVLQNQLLDKVLTPFLNTSIATTILEYGRYKNFRPAHLHSLLAPITRHRPFELLVGDYLSMPAGKGGYTKISLYADVFSQNLWAFKLKSAKGKDTINSLRSIAQNFTAPSTFMADGGSHFDCEEVKTYCNKIGTNLHITAMYSPWVNSLLEGSNGILLNALK